MEKIVFYMRALIFLLLFSSVVLSTCILVLFFVWDRHLTVAKLNHLSCIDTPPLEPFDTFQIYGRYYVDKAFKYNMGGHSVGFLCNYEFEFVPLEDGFNVTWHVLSSGDFTGRPHLIKPRVGQAIEEETPLVEGRVLTYKWLFVDIALQVYSMCVKNITGNGEDGYQILLLRKFGSSPDTGDTTSAVKSITNTGISPDEITDTNCLEKRDFYIQ